MSDFQPCIIGVQHTPDYVQQTVELIEKLGLKRVGIEFDYGYPIPFYARSGSGGKYFNDLSIALHKKGIEVIPLISPAMARKERGLIGMAFRARYAMRAFFTKKRRSARLKNSSVAFYFDIHTRHLEKNAEKEKVDGIVAGVFHCFLMRKDLRIPKNKFFAMYGPLPPTKLFSRIGRRQREEDKESTKKIVFQDLKATRRFQHWRKRYRGANK